MYRVASALSFALLLLIGIVVAGGRPGAVSSVTVRTVVAPLYAHPPGESFVTAVVKADTAAPASHLSVFLSKDRAPDAKDVRLDGKLAMPGLASGMQYTAAGQVGIPAGLKTGRYFFVVCAGDLKTAAADSCVAARTFTKLTFDAVTTRALVEAAVAKRAITPSQALTYRVFNAFGDPRIPAKYRGDDNTVDDDSVLIEALAAWPTLDVAARAAIEPYFSPPAARGSWADGRGAGATVAGDDDEPACIKDKLSNVKWDHVDTANGKVRIWWHAEAPLAAEVAKKAKQLAGEVDRVIWPKLVAVFTPKVPLSDARVECFKGGDGKLDIYFNPVARGRGVTVPYPPLCSKAPAFIVVEPDVDEWELAHEMTHAFQFAYPYKGNCGSYNWFDEGVANWGGHIAYPRDNGEHYFPALARYPNLSLKQGDYDDWIFVMYLERVYGVRILPKIYNAFARAESLPALNTAMRGGFDRTWPEFTRYAWNQEPLGIPLLTPSSFLQWDDFPVVPLDGPNKPMSTVQLALGGLEERTANVPAKLESLTRAYRRFAVVPDENVHYIKFDNTLAGIPHAQVQAFVKFADGTWETQDWTNRATVEFCLDNELENVSDLVIMYSNSDALGQRLINPAKQPTLKIRNRCDTMPYYYRVLSFTYTHHVEGSAKTTSCDWVVSGREDWSGELVSATSGAPAGYINPLQGGLIGGISFPVPVGHMHRTGRHWEGCKTESFVKVPCTVDLPDQDSTIPYPFNWQIAYNLVPGQVDVIWPIGPAFIGASPTDAGCNVLISPLIPQSVWRVPTPVDKFKPTTPILLSNKGSVHITDPATQLDVTFTWDAEVTLQRVDKDGNPLE